MKLPFMKPLQFLTLLSCAIFILPLVALADADVGIIGLEVKDNVNVVYHIKVASVREDGVSKGVAELRHLLRLYDEVGVTRDKRDIHAVFDADGVPFVVSDSAYARLGKGDTNPNTALIAELIGEGVSVEVCSQRMERDKLTSQSLLPGVKMVLGGQPRVIDLELRGYAYFRF